MPKNQAQGGGDAKAGAPGRIKPVESELFQRREPERASASTAKGPDGGAGV